VAQLASKSLMDDGVMILPGFKSTIELPNEYCFLDNLIEGQLLDLSLRLADAESMPQDSSTVVYLK
jgi:hypothetical protein